MKRRYKLGTYVEIRTVANSNDTRFERGTYGFWLDYDNQQGSLAWVWLPFTQKAILVESVTAIRKR